MPASPYRPPAAAPADLIRWSDGFGPRFAVFVDTEEAFDWRGPFTRDQHSTEAVRALPGAQARFAAAGVPLTYLVDYPIVADARAVATIAPLLTGENAIGTQLHGWVNPPFDEPLGVTESFVGNLPEALEAAKLDLLTGAITAAFGSRPRAYRAGRYGIGPHTLALLAARGYRLDSSMRAAHDYSGEGGPDFGAIGNHAFRCGPGGALVELPVTTVFTGAARGGGMRLYRALGRLPRGRGLFARARLLSRVALTPEGMPIAEALEAVRVALGEGVAVLNFAFHSPSLEPGNTPYVRNADDLRAFWRWWEVMLAALARLGVRPIGLDALIEAADHAASPPPRAA